jgi:hypothetical protein
VCMVDRTVCSSGYSPAAKQPSCSGPMQGMLQQGIRIMSSNVHVHVTACLQRGCLLGAPARACCVEWVRAVAPGMVVADGKLGCWWCLKWYTSVVSLLLC